MIYLDANATSRLRPEAREVIAHFLDADSVIGNPSSVHGLGRRAGELLDRARESLSSFLGGGNSVSGRIVFTSGGTEACNSLVHSFSPQKHIVCSAIEHQAILEPVKHLVDKGIRVHYIEPKEDGLISVDALLQSLTKETDLIILMGANNVSGCIQPIADIAVALRSKNYRGPIVSDLTQSLQKSDVDVSQLFEAGVSAVALSGHKLGALPGVGAVVFAESSDVCFSVDSLIKGGPQEERFRAGTENLLGIATLGAVCRGLSSNGAVEREKITALRDTFWQQLQEKVEDVSLIADIDSTLSNTLAMSFAGLRADDLVVALDLRGIAASTGSACSSGRQEVSHVYTAMGMTLDQARSIVRFSLDWDADSSLVDSASGIIAEVVARMRAVHSQSFQEAVGYA